MADPAWAEHELAARARQQASLADLSQRALARTDLSALLDEAVALVARTLGVDHCTVLELLPDGSDLWFRAGQGWREGVVRQAYVPAGYASQAGYTLLAGEPVIVEDFGTERRFSANPLLREHGAVSGMTVIIPGEERPFGILSVHTRQPRRFTGDDVHFLEAAGNVLAAAIKRAATEELLREREAQYRAVFDAASDGRLIRDPVTGRIVEVNAAYCRMYGYSREELIGLPHAPQMRDADPLRSESAPGVADDEIVHATSIGHRKDGTRFPIEVSSTGFLLRGTHHVLEVVHDITERVHAYELLEQRVTERTRDLSTLLQVSHNVASTIDLERLLGVILDQLYVVVPCTGAALFMVEGDELRLAGYRGPLPAERLVELRFPIAQAPGFLEGRRRGGRPVIIDDIMGEGEPAAAYRQSTNTSLDPSYAYIRSLLVVPLQVKERVIGALRLDHALPHAFNEHQAGVAMTIANQAAVAIENAQLYARAQEMAAVEERARLARELHDSVTQMLFSANLIAEVLPDLWARDAAAGRQHLDGLRLLTRGALAEMRMLLLELRPAALLQSDLGELLRQLAEATTGRKRLPIELALEGSGQLPPDVQIAFYRIAQEALNNVVKHAGASAVQVCLRIDGDRVELLVVDNGRGFATATAGSGRIGLRGMQERAAAIGASLDVVSGVAEGTRVRVFWRRAATA